jgi:hypothetical protein
MHKEQRIAKRPCKGRVEEGGLVLLCFDIFRVVKFKHGKVASIRCVTHGHRTGEKRRDLA